LSPRRKQLILCFASVLALVLFFLLPPNKTWFRETVIDYWKAFTWQRKNLDLEHRRVLRYDSSYIYSKQIAAFFQQKGNDPHALVLVPGTRYFEQYHIHYRVPEPVVFYYFTGLTTIRPADSGSAAANWYVNVKDGRLIVDSVGDPAAWPGMIQALKKIDPSL
jgi:hypothetical protein